MSDVATTPTKAPAARRDDVRAWDWPTRVFHWSLVFLVLNAWLSHRFAASFGDNSLLWHRWTGYAILVLVVFRLIWGVVGSSTALFFRFVPSPARVLAYLKGLFAGGNGHYLSHNPLGSLMVLALLGFLAVQGVMGLYTIDHNEIVAGPLKRTIDHDFALWIGKIHSQAFDYLVVLIVIHITANALYGAFKREPLIGAMVSGRKPPLAYVDAAEMVPAPRVALRAALSLGAAIAIVFGGIVLLGGRL